MGNLKLAMTVFILLLAAYLGQMLYYFPMLPENAAVHFNFSGEADSFDSKKLLLNMNLIILVMNILLFGGLATFIPKMNDWMLNLPNKEYWLSGDRRKETHKYLQGMLLWIGNLTVLVFIFIFQEIIDANLSDTKEATSLFWVYILVYIFVIIYLCVRMYKRFTKIKD